MTTEYPSNHPHKPLPESPDYRYERVECVTCHRDVQLIDFYGSQHALLCAKPVIDRATLPRGVRLA